MENSSMSTLHLVGASTPQTGIVNPEVKVPPTAEKRIAQYVAVRDRIEDLKEKQAAEMKPLLDLQNLLSGWLQQHLETTGAESVKTSSGTAYISTRFTASLADPDAFMKFVIEQHKFELMDRRANATAVKDYVQENGGLPPGVNLSGIKTVGVRRAS